VVPSLFTATMSPVLASTRDSSSMTSAVAMASAPAPPYSSGTCSASRSFLRRPSCTSHG
jgi:hypothetical protein